MNPLTVAVLAGGTVGFGVWLAWSGWSPARPPLAQTLVRLGQPIIEIAPERDNLDVRVGVWARRLGPVDRLVESMRADLRVLRRSPDEQAALIVVYTLCGLLWAPVVLWLGRSNDKLGYTLLVVGDTINQTAVFDQLNVVAPNASTDVSKLQRTKPDLKPVAELIAWAEGAEGERLPFNIVSVRGVATLTAAKQQQRDVYLAVAGSAAAGYRLYAVVGRDNQDSAIFGPGNEDIQVKCDRWRGRAGFIYRLLRRWYRC